LENFDTAAFKEVKWVVNQVLQEAKLEKGDIDGIILTGNPAHVKKIVCLFEINFGAEKILRGICSDEAVIQGLVAQAEILSSGQSVIDWCCSYTVAPLSLGIETIGARFIKIIPRNTVIPDRKSLIISTVKDNQSKIDLRIFQGERAMTGRNKHVGTLEINGIPAARKGIPQITVAFEHDDDRTLTVSAVNNASGEIFQLVVVLDNTRDEIEERIADQAAHAEEDSDSLNAFVTIEQNNESEYESGAVLSGFDTGM
jgi:molecular chaperone DnaK (HSP70)